MSEKTTKEEPLDKMQRLSNLVSNKYNADVILYSGDIDYIGADRLIYLSKQSDRKENIVLMLTTSGGSPDAAYRMARCLQRQYKKIILYIYGICKSAGTLVAVGANEIILSDFGELGPLDIQLGKHDELFETVSGLNITQALNSLSTRARDMFRDMLVELKGGSHNQISTRLAAEIASNLTIGLYGKIYAQIDPSQLGSIERSINIASDYGKLIKTDNVKDDTIDKLVISYSSHSFVIDIKEAKELFNIVRMPDENEDALAQCIDFISRKPVDNQFILKLNAVEKEILNEQPSNTSNIQCAS